MPKPLPSYLRTERKKRGLTQEEVAYLLGVQSGTKVSRYERRARTPTLGNLFAIQVVYGAAPHELFPGVFEEIKKTVIKRATVLAIEVRSLHTGPQAKRKLAALEVIIRSESAVQRQTK
jgi:transcriptional regulator with XRE-family HTH domain